MAQNIFVHISLQDGSVGFGEIALFTDLTGETVEASLKTAKSLATSILGTPATNYRRCAQQFQEMAPEFPAVRCGIETALLDAFCRSATIPLWALWVRTVADAQRVIQHQAADFINLKITKSGVMEILDIVSIAKSSGVKLMIGGMVETRVAMGCSFGLVLGLGGIEYLDLDTPLLLERDPVEGGFAYQGARLQPWAGAGLDVSLTPPAHSIVIQ